MADNPAAVEAMRCLEFLDLTRNVPVDLQRVAVAVAQVHATLAVAESIDKLRASPPAGFIPPWAAEDPS